MTPRGQGGLRMIPRRLVVTGSVMVDILLYLDALPSPGGAANARRALVTPGAGYNLLAAASRLGLPAAYAGLTGEGPFGTLVRQALNALGVPVLLAPRTDADTGFDVGLVEASSGGQPTFLGAPGVESRLAAADLRAVALADGDAVYLSGYDLWYPEAGAALTEWAGGLGPGCLQVFDPGPLAGQLDASRLEASLARADILSLNLAEAAAIAGDHDPPALATGLARRLPVTGWVILRAGPDGCWICRRGAGPRHVPARPATPVDTTGAGDVHVAALLALLSAGHGMAEAAWGANAAASLAVEREGPAASPTASELAQAMAGM